MKKRKKAEDKKPKRLFNWHDTNDSGVLIQHRYKENIPTVIGVEERIITPLN